MFFVPEPLHIHLRQPGPCAHFADGALLAVRAEKSDAVQGLGQGALYPKTKFETGHGLRTAEHMVAIHADPVIRPPEEQNDERYRRKAQDEAEESRRELPPEERGCADRPHYDDPGNGQREL